MCQLLTLKRKSSQGNVPYLFLGWGGRGGLYFRVTQVFSTFLTDRTFSVFEKKRIIRDSPKSDQHKKPFFFGTQLFCRSIPLALLRSLPSECITRVQLFSVDCYFRYLFTKHKAFLSPLSNGIKLFLSTKGFYVSYGISLVFLFQN